jgi:hypothetical protein
MPKAWCNTTIDLKMLRVTSSTTAPDVVVVFVLVVLVVILAGAGAGAGAVVVVGVAMEALVANASVPQFSAVLKDGEVVVNTSGELQDVLAEDDDTLSLKYCKRSLPNTSMSLTSTADLKLHSSKLMVLSSSSNSSDGNTK